MDKKITASGVSLFLVLMTSALVFAASNPSMTVEANIFQSGVQVEIPDSVFFGNLTKGYLSDRSDIDVNNTGTEDITVTPQLANETEEIFSYIHFRRILADDLTRIGNFSINVSKPSDIGEVEDESIYMYLDLRDYPNDIPENKFGHQSEVTFWATAQ